MTTCAGSGFFIGDGAGVGKGRQIAGVILDNYARGRRRAIWISTSTVLPPLLTSQSSAGMRAATVGGGVMRDRDLLAACLSCMRHGVLSHALHTRGAVYKRD